MTETDGVEIRQKAALRRERWTVCLFLLFTMLTLSHFVHDHWYAMDPRPRVKHLAPPPAAIPSATPVPRHVGYAPNVYRVGTPFVVGVLERVLPVHWSVILALMDFLFGSVGLYALYRVLVDNVSLDAAVRGYRGALVLGFLSAIQLPLNWVVPWQRPETMPSTCYLGLAAWCLLRLRRGWLPFALLLLLTVLQALTRSDVAACFGAAVLGAGLIGGLFAQIDSRRKVLACGAAVIAVAVAVQAYLQLVAFPHAVYPPDTPLFVLPYNFSAHNLNLFTLAVLPAAVVIGAGWRCGQRWRAVDTVALFAAALYLPVWYLIGSTAEVRIFVPFLLFLCIPAARVLAGLLTGESTQQG